MRQHLAAIHGSGVEPAALGSSALDLGYDGVGLDHPLYLPQWEKLRATLPRESIHAIRLFLPYPREVRPGAPCPFVLGSMHSEGARDALKQALETVELAGRQLISVILAGPIELDDAPRGRRLDSFRSLLSRLLDAAARHPVHIAVIPGDLPYQVPSSEEIARLLREFRGGPLRVWLDARAAAAPGEGGDQAPASMEDLKTHLAGATLRDDSALPLLAHCAAWMADPAPDSAGGGLEQGLRLIEMHTAAIDALAKPEKMGKDPLLWSKTAGDLG